jgi:hypothetical protein
MTTQSEFRTGIEVEKVDLLQWHDLITDIATGQDLSYRVDEAQAVLRGMSRYLGQLVNVDEQDTP